MAEATSENEDLSSKSKARRLVKAFSEKGFDYVGNDSTDLAVTKYPAGEGL